MRSLIKNVSVSVMVGFMMFSFVFVSPVVAQTERQENEKEILVIGRGRVDRGNIAGAKQAAIANALILGVEAYLTRRLGSQAMIDNFSKLINDIIPNAKDEIENFNILAEDRKDNNYRILVRLKINEKVMEEKLRDIVGHIAVQGPPIKTLFLVSEIDATNGEMSYWWGDPEGIAGLTPTELALHRVFQERGLNPINRLLNIPEEKYSSEMKAWKLTDMDALKWGRIYDAEVVIRGECEISQDRSVNVSLSALEVAEGNVIYSAADSENIDEGPDSKELMIKSIEKAVSDIADRMIPPIMRVFEHSEARLSRFEITLTGVKNFKQFTDYRTFLKQEIDGVKTVKQTRIRGNAISFLVEYAGGENRFLELLSNHQNLPFEADVTKTEDGAIIINIR